MKIDSSIERVTQHLRTLAAQEKPGVRMPSVRASMTRLGVGPVTVQRALDRLVREGVLETQPGRGTFVGPGVPAIDAAPADLDWQSVALGPARAVVAPLASLCLVPPDQARALNAGYLPPELQPSGLLEAATARARLRPGLWGRMPPVGQEALRAWFARESGGAFSPREVTICPGTQAANAAAFRALALPGDPVLIESPTYLGALAAAQQAGLRIVPVATDAEGVRPDLLADAFQRTGARLFYCQPRHANPTGAVLSSPRRAAVLDAVRTAGAFLIEDDWARDFHLDGPPALPPLAAADPDGHVVYIRSLTKCVAPGLRIGAICARGPALARLREARLVDDFFVPGLLQEVALQLVTAASWPRHLAVLRASLRRRRDALAASLRRHLGPGCLPHVPAGGLHLWVRLPEGVDDFEIEQQAATRGILVSAGRHWHPAEPPAPFLRLSFGAADPDWIDACVAELANLNGFRRRSL